MSNDDELNAAKIVGSWYWQMAEGHNFRWKNAVKSMILFYESAPLESDMAQLVIEYLRTRTSVTSLVIAHKNWTFAAPGWNAKDAWYQTVPGEQWAGTESKKVRVYWVLVEAGDGAADGPYTVENGCKYKVDHLYYWDVAAAPTLPQSESGVQYTIQGFTRDRETGLFTYIVEKRETVEQSIPLYESAKTIFETVSEQQFLGVKQGSVAGKGLPASVGNGERVERHISKNPDCTSDILNRKVKDHKQEQARVVAEKKLRGTSVATTDRNLTPGEVAAKTATQQEVGETRTIEKTDTDLRNLTVEKTTPPTLPLTLAKSCEKETSVHTDTTVELVQAGAADGSVEQTVEPNKRKTVSVRKNDDGKTADKTTTEQTWSEKTGGGSSNSGNGVVTTTTERKENTTASPTATPGVNKVVEIEETPNDHGSKTTIQRVTEYHEKTAVATSDMPTERTVTTTKINTLQGDPTATQGSAAAQPNEHGSQTTQVSEITPKPCATGWITWQTAEDGPRHTYTYTCGVRIFRNQPESAIAALKNGARGRIVVNASLNRFALLDGTITYSHLESWAERPGAGGTFGGSQERTIDYKYISDYTIEESGGQLTVTPQFATQSITLRTFYGRGNEGSEAAAAALAIPLPPGLHVTGRTYVTSPGAATMNGIIQSMHTAQVKLQTAYVNHKTAAANAGGAQ